MLRLHGIAVANQSYDKTHRAVDERCEVITAKKITPGSVDDGHVLNEMIEAHEQNTQKKVDTAVGDSKYGTIDNFLLCHDLGIKTHSFSTLVTPISDGQLATP